MVAAKVEVDDDGEGGRNKVDGEGTLGAITGACPAVTITVRGYPVRTSATTTFTGGTCESIRPGTKIDVTGTVDDTGVDATAVAIKR